MTELLLKLKHEFELPLQNPVLVFATILFIILLSPILLRKLNIPGIIGLILAGMIIGPNGAHLLENNEAIKLFSTIGLLYIMFIAGIELDLNDFKANRNKSFLFGLLTFSIPLGIGFPVCFYLLNYNFSASLLTASMFATHTLVAYPIVSKFGLSKNPAVAVAVGGTILTDTAVLILLAVVVGQKDGQIGSQFWINLLVSLSLFSAFMFGLIPRLAKWFFNKLESEKHSHYIFVLSVVFLSAFLAELSGLEPIIGAFVAGLALNKLIPHSSALMNRIEFIGNALFIPFFLISVGMLVNLKVLFNGPTAIIIAVTLTLVAVLGKWLAAFFTQKAFNFSSFQRQLIFGLSSAHAAATLAVILVGYRAGILDEKILNGTIVLILFTCIIASFATEKAARNLVISGQSANIVPSLPTSFTEHILLPIANASNFNKLLDFASALKDKKSANPISLLSVVSNNEEAEINLLKTRSHLEVYVKEAAASETKVNILTTIDHNPAGGICRISREIMADIIIMGWPKPSGIVDKIIGEKVEVLLNQTDKALFICHIEKNLFGIKSIVVSVPPLAEYEKGFAQWVIKLTQLASELRSGITYYCLDVTAQAIQKLLKNIGQQNSPVFVLYQHWPQFELPKESGNFNQLFVRISARKGATSYQGETLQDIFEKNMKQSNRMVVFPNQFSDESATEYYRDVSAEALTKSIKTFQDFNKRFWSRNR